MKKIRGLLAVTLIIMIGIVSCSKTGPTGAQGPVGPAGPDSVLYSAWIPLTFTVNNVNSDYEDTLITPSLTKAILDNGVILTYVSYPDSVGISHVVAVSSLSNVILEDYQVGQINIVTSINFTQPLPYRYVLIPGSVVLGTGDKARVGAYTVGELKSMPYEQVQKALAQPNN